MAGSDHLTPYPGPGGPALGGQPNSQQTHPEAPPVAASQTAPTRPDVAANAEDVVSPLDRPGAPSAEFQRELIMRMLDLVPDFFYVHDEDLRFYYANKAAAEYFGLTKEAIVGKLLIEVDKNESQARRIEALCQQIMASGQARTTDRIQYSRRDGSPGFLRQHDIPFINPVDNRRMMIGVSRDVTTEVELALQEMRAAGLQRELEIARSIQRSLRPSDGEGRSVGARPGPPGGLDLAAHCEPAAYAGGDFYDWFSTPGAPDRIVVCIGDVTGHGVGPALLAAECRAYARVVLSEHDLPRAFCRLSELTAADFRDGRFVTFAAAVIDTNTGKAELMSAGHGPLLARRADGTLSELEVQHPPLGLSQLVEEPASRVRLDPGDLLVLTSDGVYEAPEPGGGRFGIPRLLDALRAGSIRGGQGLVDEVIRQLSEFQTGQPAEDDVTIVVAGRRP